MSYEKDKDVEKADADISVGLPHTGSAAPVAANTHTVRLAEADEVAALVAGHTGEVDAAEAARVRRKIDWHLMPPLMLLYLVQFTDKTTLGSSSILGIKKDNHLSAAQYNWLATIFYLAYLVFEWPQNLALQRFPPAKWMSLNIFIWSIMLFAQAGCHNFAGLFVCRLFLGVCEGSITAGYLIITSMFYTHEEAARRVGYWFLMNGTAQIFSGLVSFGVYHVDAKKFAPWRLFHIITAAVTLFMAAAFYWFVPDSPLNARFLDKEEKVVAIERLKNASSGIENKTWKREQFVEALKDWKVWAFFLYASVAQLPNSLTNQNALIINSFGWTVKETTLLGIVPGALEIIAILASSALLKRFKNSRTWIGPLFVLPNFISALLIISLPWHKKGALLAAMYIGGLGGAPAFVIALGWCTATNAGHTKKTTANTFILIGYCLGNLLAPQMWEARYAPRYYVPWGVILGSYVVASAFMVGIGLALRKENNRRDALAAAGELPVQKYYDENGNEVDPTFLDLTDRQNLAYRYPL
ncbi:hypothetical protein Q8F55_009262 [Vanrija albida]|uniref:Major facilitator superfamily (MFS) profile domain-containing protein n=1 Tax=Vanrija albida TaxID=181172 RepID=A0ABR3PT56_9TREE